MDDILITKDKPWIHKDRFRIKDELTEKEELLKKEGVTLNCSSCDPELKLKLEQFVARGRKDVISSFGFNTDHERHLIVEPECNLKVYELQLEHAGKIISDSKYKANYLSSLKTTRKDFLMREAVSFQKSQNRGLATATSDSTAAPSTTLTVATCDGKTIMAVVVVQMWSQPSRLGKPRLQKEVRFHGSQMLTELRDLYECRKDYKIPIDLSEDPDQDVRNLYLGELFKSGYFLIEDTFYNDLRDPNNKDLSIDTIRWAEEKVSVSGEDGKTRLVSRGIGPLKRARMGETKFEDLSIRLGNPYSYRHLGDCEHIFCISDIEYVPVDRIVNTIYPEITAVDIGPKESPKCLMCKSRPPHWYTRNNERLPVDPYFFCDKCFRLFNYDNDKKKIGNFQAYLYSGAMELPENFVRSDGGNQ